MVSRIRFCRDIKPSSFMSELDKSNKKAELLIQRAPHIIPHKDVSQSRFRLLNWRRNYLLIGMIFWPFWMIYWPFRTILRQKICLQRVVLFRKYVSIDKDSLGLTNADSLDRPSTLITVHRTRIVEDGYRQLSLLPAKTLKGVVRVKFINEQVGISSKILWRLDWFASSFFRAWTNRVSIRTVYLKNF